MDTQIIGLVAYTERQTRVKLETFLYADAKLRCRVYLIENSAILKSQAMFSNNKELVNMMAPDSATGQKPDALSETTLKIIIAMEKMQN
jgi:hypothetical protein